VLKEASYRQRSLFTKCRSFNYASIGTIPDTIGTTGELVEQFEVMSFFERQNNFSVFCKYLLKGASYRKRPYFKKYSPINYASNGSVLEPIGATGESVEQFQLMSFFERLNNFFRFL